MSNILRTQERKRKRELLAEMTDDELINEIKKRKKINDDYELMWIHKSAYYREPGDIKKAAEQINREAAREIEQEQLKERLKKDAETKK